MSIDWDKANGSAVAALIAKKNNIHYPGFEFVSGYHRTGCMIRATSADDGSPLSAPEDVWEIVERPVTWNGQGLPPVGIEAEAIWDGADIAYFRAKILAHDEGRVVFRWCEGKRKGQYGSYAVLKFGSLPAFRPLRTPEQIAAEEREKAVGDMAMSIQGVPYQYPTLYALFDAGYRRQEEGK
ncbi:TPA: hypothetical protein ACQT1A_003471 [Pseudomonas aeruginosa]|uniref:hypothetical protein n=1 Tax=Pseudomonas aeruginosa TaxID=287 RepID=UPI00068C225E|nr:hypothetical protein [Pseudomonas aeruginosa]MBA5191045.1 hypothetical protein [Pseudomonas aeruginosa]OVZ15325.1 hypothetical protein CDO38_31290 [Pseudomonas aeruginosa]OVZ69359.1 hypothetical protein CDO43_19005 [Pseudomonas aeruginosa]